MEVNQILACLTGGDKTLKTKGNFSDFSTSSVWKHKFISIEMTVFGESGAIEGRSAATGRR